MPSRLQAQDGRWELVERLLDSGAFRKAPRQRELLRFLARHAIDHPDETLHEQRIGHLVYQRSPDYNPAEDSIVRVEVRNLRKRLREYFASEGKRERMIIEVPKGSYRLVFTPRPTGAAYRPFAVPLAAAILITALAAVSWQNNSLQRAARGALPPPPPHVILRALCASDGPIFIVVADSSWALVQDLLGRTGRLSDYLASRRIPEELPPLWRPLQPALERIASRQFTSFADARLVARLARSAEFGGRPFQVRHARSMNIRDFQEASAIVLGSARSNPWVELFEDTLNFRFDYDSGTGAALVRNRSPRPGEALVYKAEEGAVRDAYALVSLVDNLSKKGKILLIAGTGLEATEAAGEFILDSDAARTLASELKLEKGSRLRSFEVLLRTSVIEGTPKKATVIAHRVLDF